MSLKYPENTIWYVEASSVDGQERSSGSAVAVWLREIDKPATRRKCLLTCGHVVRGNVPGSTARDKEAGFGPILPNIGAWAPDTGFALTQKVEAVIADEINVFVPGVVPPRDRANAANDWVLLSLENPQASLAAESVREFAEPASGKLMILGYPGGAESFIQGKVVPTRSNDLSFRDHYQGVVRLNGTETRSGMSGGGVFDEADALVGIHRSRLDGVLQCHSVSMVSIREQLHAAGYELVSGPQRPPGVNRRVLLRTGAGCLAAAAVGSLFFIRKRTPIRIGIKQWVGYVPLVVAAKLDLCKDIEISFVRVEEIWEARDKLRAWEIDGGMWLAATHVINRSLKTPGRMVLKLDDSFYEDGIVARVSILTAEDLKGKTVAFQQHDAGHCMLLALCRKTRVNIADIKLKHVPAKDVPYNFKQNSNVAAATSYETHLSEAGEIPGAKILGRAKDFDMGEFGIVDALAVHEGFLNEHEGSVRSLIEGWYEAVELLRKQEPAAIRIACEFMGQNPTADPVVFDEPLAEADLKVMIRDDHVKLAGRKENDEFFRRDQDGMSAFRRHYEYYKKVWGDALGAGDTDFTLADGSQMFLPRR